MGIGTLRRHHAARYQSATAGAPSPGGAPDDTWTVKELKAYAVEHEIDLTGATKKPEILERIVAAQPPAPAGDPQPEAFDPGAHTPEKVLEYLTGLDDTDTEAHDAEVARIVEAEKAGQNRPEVLGLVEGTPAEG